MDYSDEAELIDKGIVNCIELAKDGIHAILVVFSFRNRFSREEEAVLQRLQNLFGDQIADYMVVVFTGGDEFEDSDETLEDYLGWECPEPLKDVLKLCQNRYLLFDNKTCDEDKRAIQLNRVLHLINSILLINRGRPYPKDKSLELEELEEQLDLITDMVTLIWFFKLMG